MFLSSMLSFWKKHEYGEIYTKLPETEKMSNDVFFVSFAPPWYTSVTGRETKSQDWRMDFIRFECTWIAVSGVVLRVLISYFSKEIY